MRSHGCHLRRGHWDQNCRPKPTVPLTRWVSSADSESSWSEAARRSGAPPAFADVANFSGMGSRVKIGDIVHRAIIEVADEGAESAAVTAVALAKVVSIPLKRPTPVLFIVGRPFLF